MWASGRTPGYLQESRRPPEHPHVARQKLVARNSEQHGAPESKSVQPVSRGPRGPWLCLDTAVLCHLRR